METAVLYITMTNTTSLPYSQNVFVPCYFGHFILFAFFSFMF
jgi:hypothetical protein